MTNSNDSSEQKLIHPPQNYIPTFDSNAIPPCDKYYVDIYKDLNQEASSSKNQIIRIDINEFNIERYNNTGIAISCFFGAIIIPIIAYFSVDLKNCDIMIYIGLAINVVGLIIAGIYYFFFSFGDKYLILDFGSIIIRKKARCRTDDTIYLTDEIERAELYFTYNNNNDGFSNVYKFVLCQKNGIKEIIHEIGSIKKDIELEGLKYFVDLINIHIMKNRKIFSSPFVGEEKDI